MSARVVISRLSTHGMFAFMSHAVIHLGELQDRCLVQSEAGL